MASLELAIEHSTELPPELEASAVGETLEVADLVPLNDTLDPICSELEINEGDECILLEENAVAIEDRWKNFDVHEETVAPVEETDNKKSSKRKRTRVSNAEKREEEIKDNAYKHSQKRLRKEAKNLNLRDLIAKTLNSGADSNSTPYSPVLASPNTPSSPWSPQLASDITNQFLNNVKKQQQQTFQKIITKEMGHSQPSSRSQAYTKRILEVDPDGSMKQSVTGVEEMELVIEKEETIEKGSDFLDDTSRTTSFNFDSQRIPSYLGDSSDTNRTTATDREKEKAEIRALTRKHEIWKLKQRQTKANALLNSNGNPHSSTTTAPPSAPSTTTTDVGRNSDSLPLSLKAAIENRPLSTPTIKETKLSMDDISMIRRINSFDNTSSKRVVVFGTSLKENSNSKSMV